MKRFWSRSHTAQTENGFTVMLDGRPAKLPGQARLFLDGERLAAAIADEWGNAGETFTADDLPLTRLAATAQNQVAMHVDDMISRLADYGMNDLLCYRAAEQPALAALEAASWQIWLDWAAEYCGAALRITRGIIPIAQPPSARAAFETALRGMTIYHLAGLGVIVPALGSLVLGLAVAANALAAPHACELAELGAIWQEQKWGTDPDAIQRRQRLTEDVAAAARFMVLCQP